MTPQGEVFRFKHNSHPSTAKLFEDAVVRDGLADKRIGCSHFAFILGWGESQVNEQEKLHLQVHINAVTGDWPRPSSSFACNPRFVMLEAQVA